MLQDEAPFALAYLAVRGCLGLPENAFPNAEIAKSLPVDVAVQ